MAWTHVPSVGRLIVHAQRNVRCQSPKNLTKSSTHQYLQTVVAYDALTSGTNYVPPQKNDAAVKKKCECNTVIYSLVVACSLCQTFAAHGPQRYALSKSPQNSAN